MPMKIEVLSTETNVKSGTNGRGPWEIVEQTAYLFKGTDDKYPEEIVVTLDKNQTPYQPGMYVLDDKSFYVGQYKQLQCKPRLRPLVQQAKQATA